MKKISLFLLLVILLVSGCSKKEETVKDKINKNFDMIMETSNIVSSNPFDYIDNEYYDNIVDLGIEAIPILENMYKDGNLSGVTAYISALAIEDISECDLYQEYGLKWDTAEEFYDLWNDYHCSYER